MDKSISPVIEHIVQLVNEEFGDKAALFDHIVLRMDERDCDEFERTKVAGVYVFVDDMGQCIKVGKSQSNGSKRALEHCGSDNTSSKDKEIQMSKLLHSDKTYMLVFALKETNSIHWVLALENYLEEKLKPRIPSQRNG